MVPLPPTLFPMPGLGSRAGQALRDQETPPLSAASLEPDPPAGTSLAARTPGGSFIQSGCALTHAPRPLD